MTPIVMPKWGLSMKEGTVNAWLVEEGATIAADIARLGLDLAAADAPLLAPGIGAQGGSGRELAEVAHELDARHGIQVRVGLHCAPSAHRTLDTFPTGAIRFSVGWANTEDDVDAALAALREILA